MTARSPELGHRGANGSVVLVCVCVNIASVCDLALGCRIDTMNLAGRQTLELFRAKLLCQGINARMLQQLIARLVYGRYARLVFELARARDLLGIVVAGIQKLEEASYGVNVVARELNLSRLLRARLAAPSCNACH